MRSIAGITKVNIHIGTVVPQLHAIHGRKKKDPCISVSLIGSTFEWDKLVDCDGKRK